MEKRDNWFKDYQNIPELGVQGQRKIEDRLRFFSQKDFENASVLDIGSNMGQMSFQAEKWKASKVLGVEYDLTALKKAIEFRDKLKSKAKFVLDDIDNPLFWNSIDRYDVSLFLSVIDTQELLNRYGDLAKLSSKTKKVMYFEGHHNIPFSKYIKNILDYTDFTQLEYKGTVEDDRVFIRCSKDILTSEECVVKIKECEVYNKIAIVGKSGAGKTYIRKMYEKENNRLIIDDLKINDKEWISQHSLQSKEKLILFDYCALKYVNDFDVVFFICQDSLEDSGTFDYQMRSPIGSFQNVKRIYTVKSR